MLAALDSEQPALETAGSMNIKPIDQIKFELESSSGLISEAYGGCQKVEKKIGFRIWIAISTYIYRI